jgi:hypothetical protein
MKCDRYEKFGLGELNAAFFRLHALFCAECRKKRKKDKLLLSETRSLRIPIDETGLWDRIENSLKSEKKPQKERQRIRFELRHANVFHYAAASLLIIITAAIFLFNPFEKKSGLLAQKALDKIERKEASYVQAIEELEKIALPKMSDMELELMLLYRERLETIDDQIVQCREALNQNPANAHIRRYMLSALQDKKMTLREIVNFKKDS